MPYVRDGPAESAGGGEPEAHRKQPRSAGYCRDGARIQRRQHHGNHRSFGTPKDLLHRISADIAQVVREPDAIERMASLGMEPVGSTPEEYDALIRSEIDKWAGLSALQTSGSSDTRRACTRRRSR